MPVWGVIRTLCDPYCTYFQPQVMVKLTRRVTLIDVGSHPIGWFSNRGPFLESPENFSDPKSQLSNCNPVVLKSWSFNMLWMLNQEDCEVWWPRTYLGVWTARVFVKWRSSSLDNSAHGWTCIPGHITYRHYYILPHLSVAASCKTSNNTKTCTHPFHMLHAITIYTEERETTGSVLVGAARTFSFLDQ